MMYPVTLVVASLECLLVKGLVIMRLLPHIGMHFWNSLCETLLRA
jgi:hypothetical protein